MDGGARGVWGEGQLATVAMGNRVLCSSGDLCTNMQGKMIIEGREVNNCGATVVREENFPVYEENRARWADLGA